MSYIKATAEVVVLNTQDVVTISGGEAARLIGNLSPEAQEQLLGGNNPILHNGAEGLANLLNDLQADGGLASLAEGILEILYEAGASQGAVNLTQFEIAIESIGCGGPHRDRYNTDEEDDSFDSEW